MPNSTECWQARDRAAPERVVLMAADGTRDEFLVVLAEKFGDDWVHGTPEYGPRLAVEPISHAVFDARMASGDWKDELETRTH